MRNLKLQSKKIYAISNGLKLNTSTNIQKPTNLLKKTHSYLTLSFNKIKFVHWQRLNAWCYV